jgi:hypothetical protein
MEPADSGAASGAAPGADGSEAARREKLRRAGAALAGPDHPWGPGKQCSGFPATDQQTFGCPVVHVTPRSCVLAGEAFLQQQLQSKGTAARSAEDHFAPVNAPLAPSASSTLRSDTASTSKTPTSASLRRSDSRAAPRDEDLEQFGQLFEVGCCVLPVPLGTCSAWAARSQTHSCTL